MERLIEDKFKDQYYKGQGPSTNSKKYYVVFEGLDIGIFDLWEHAELQVKGIAGAKHKLFKNYMEAEISLKQYLGCNEADQNQHKS